MQHITISGRIGKDAETRNVGDSTVTSFNIAVDQGYGDKKKTNWFRVSAWGKKGAGCAPYLLKGGVVAVVGELEIGEYNGEAQYNVRASDFTLPPKSSSGVQREQSDDYRGNSGTPRSQEQAYGGGTSASFGDALDDEVPFLTAAPIDNQRRRVI